MKRSCGGRGRVSFITTTKVTTNDYHDGDVLDATEELIEQASADGGYDHRHCYDEIEVEPA